MNEVHMNSKCSISNSCISNSCILRFLTEHSWNILSGNTILKIQDSLEVDVRTEKYVFTFIFFCEFSAAFLKFYSGDAGLWIDDNENVVQSEEH